MIDSIEDKEPQFIENLRREAIQEYNFRRNALIHEISRLEEDMMHNMVGEGKKNKDLGLSTTQINDLMKGYPDYLGCIGSDQILKFNIKPQCMFGFVMNTDPS